MMIDSVREGRYYPGILVVEMRSIIQGHVKKNCSTASIWAGSISNATQDITAVLIMLSYKPKDISRTGPTHVGTSGRLIIWLPRQANNFVPLKTSNFFWLRIELVNLYEGSCSNCGQFWKNYFAYGNWRLLQLYLWLLQWRCLLPAYLLLFQWCLSIPGSCLARLLRSPALDNSTAHWSLSVLQKL